MALQTAQAFTIAYKPETVFNTPVSGAAGYVFRANAGGGLKLARALIENNELRADGKPQMPRLGSKSVTGSYIAQMSNGTFDPLLEAMFRSTYVAAVAITQATTLGGSAAATSVTTGANSIIAAAGSWILQGVRVGDVVRLAGFTDAANNGRNIRITSVSALTLGTAETLIVNGTPDTSFTVTIQKKLIMGTTPTRRSFTFEQYAADIDLSKIATGVRVSSMKITGQPDQMALVEFGLVGADMAALATGTSPTFSAPTLTATIPLTWLDATIRVNGADRVNLTAFELMFDMGAKGMPVIGTNVTPDVFEGISKLSGSFSGLLPDLADFSAFTAETEFEFMALLVEPESEPKDNISLFASRLKYTGFDDSIGGDGGAVVSLPWVGGSKGAGVSGFDDSPLTLTTSAA